MNDNEARDPVFSHELADYIDVGAAGVPDIVCIRVAEELSESPNMQTVTKHYTGSRSAIEIPVGFQTDISFSVDMYKHEKVVLWLRDIAEEQKLGTQADYFSVRLYEPIEEKKNTFYARKFSVSPVISSIARKGGSIVSISGSFKPSEDVTIGEFNTQTRTFTALADIYVEPDSALPVTPTFTAYSSSGLGGDD